MKELGYAEDPYSGSYEWGFARVIEKDGAFLIIEDSGCSCNGPGSNPDDGHVTCGPAATLGGLFDQLYVDLKNEKAKAYGPTIQSRLAFIDALEKQNQETITAAKAALGVK